MSSPVDMDQSRKPADTPFKQQRLWAWQPILSPRWVISCFFFIAAAFIPIGALVTVASNDVQEIEVRYDTEFDCPWAKDVNNPDCYGPCSSPTNATCGTEKCGMIGGLAENCPRRFDQSSYVFNPTQLRSLDQCDPRCTGRVKIEIPETMKPPIYMYYKLTSFYQNHRRYAKSRSDKQLARDSYSSSELEDCPPLQEPGQLHSCEPDLDVGCDKVPIVTCTKTGGSYINSTTGKCFSESKRTTINGLTYSPCGLVAWSQFNDSFVLRKDDLEVICDGENVTRTASNCQREGIAWEADSKEKFQAAATSPTTLTQAGFKADMDKCIDGGETCDTWAGSEVTAILPFLYSGWYMSEPYHKIPQTDNEEFMVWMRTASLPTFRKLYRKITYGGNELPAGTYWIDINHRFDTSGFSGEKFIVLSTLTWIGGKNYFLGITYIAIGCLCVMLACTFAVKHMFFRTNRQEAMQSYTTR